jgi:hypothetical protein
MVTEDMNKSSTRRYFKSADQFRNKVRDPDLAKYDVIDEESQRRDELEIKKAQTRRLTTIIGRWQQMIPVRGPKDPKLAVVYFIKAENFVKISIAARWDKRLQVLRNATDVSELQLLWTTPGSGRMLMKLQGLFEHLRVSGDWFEASGEEIVSFTRTRGLGDQGENVDEDG